MPLFKNYSNVAVIIKLINDYFHSVGMEVNIKYATKRGRKLKKQLAQKKSEIIVKQRVTKKSTSVIHDPPTLTGLALFLGFNSMEEFEQYENNGRYSPYVKRAHLIIAAVYEKKLHNSYTSGAIFALKAMKWNEKTDDKALKASTNLTIQIIEAGPALAASEKEVVLELNK